MSKYISSVCIRNARAILHDDYQISDKAHLSALLAMAQESDPQAYILVLLRDDSQDDYGIQWAQCESIEAVDKLAAEIGDSDWAGSEEA